MEILKNVKNSKEPDNEFISIFKETLSQTHQNFQNNQLGFTQASYLTLTIATHIKQMLTGR